MMKFLSRALMVAVLLCSVPADSPRAQQGDDAARMTLARQMNEISPARAQVDAAIDEMTALQPEAQRESLRKALRVALDYAAIEKTSIEAMAKTYTAAELKAMVDYYSRPEAKSAAAKQKDYAGLVYPEIVRALDAAMMKVKTGP